MDRATGVQVGGASDRDLLPLGEHGARLEAGIVEHRQRDVVEWDPRRAARLGGASGAQFVDEGPEIVHTVPHHRRRPSNGGRGDRSADHQDP
jgi:hypothetical protein